MPPGLMGDKVSIEYCRQQSSTFFQNILDLASLACGKCSTPLCASRPPASLTARSTTRTWASAGWRRCVPDSLRLTRLRSIALIMSAADSMR